MLIESSFDATKMPKMLAVLLMALSAAACATPPERKLRENEVLALAKGVSSTYCHGGRPGGYVADGCEYTPKFYDNTWTVMAYAKLRDAEGKPVQYMGGGMLYIFTPTGKLLSALPGK
jgi:hypothetical protein